MTSSAENLQDMQSPAQDAVVPQNDPAVPTLPTTPVVVKERVYRHKLPVRLGHWLTVVCLFILIMSGLQIFNAHPALYWGDRSDRDRNDLPNRAQDGH